MADTFELEIVTPDKLVVKDAAEEMQIPGKNGYLGILPGHAPLISELAVGQISYRNGSETHYLCVAWGFAEVLPDKVTILAETAERGEDVDCARAQKAKERAEKRLTSADPEVDVERAKNALAKANSRLDAAAKEGQTAAQSS
jgi:F-type H+-transporting ATPase subunit epsilon